MTSFNFKILLHLNTSSGFFSNISCKSRFFSIKYQFSCIILRIIRRFLLFVIKQGIISLLLFSSFLNSQCRLVLSTLSIWYFKIVATIFTCIGSKMIYYSVKHCVQVWLFCVCCLNFLKSEYILLSSYPYHEYTIDVS